MLATATSTRQTPRAPEQRLRLGTVKDVVAAHPGLSEAAVRALIFAARENGLAPHVHRIGRRVFVDLNVLEAWILSQ